MAGLGEIEGILSLSLRLGHQAPQGDAPFEEGRAGIEHVFSVGKPDRDCPARRLAQGRVVRQPACQGHEIRVAGVIEHVVPS